MFSSIKKFRFSKRHKSIPFIISLLPIFFLIIILVYSIVILKIDPHIPILIAAFFAAIVAIIYGRTWNSLEEGILDTISSSLLSLIILMLIGILVASFIFAGVVPAIIYYGLKLISPSLFLPLVTIISAIVATSIGSSWSTVATMGIAFLGIGNGLGFPGPLTAGAVMSGAYFGDKISPLSDSTNLASSIVDVPLFKHVANMLKPSSITIIICIILYFFVGLYFTGAGIDTSNEGAKTIVSILTDMFTISPINLLPILLMLYMIHKKIPTIIVLVISSTLCGFFAYYIQDFSLQEILSGLHYGFQSTSNNKIVDTLLSKGGLDSMLWTVSFILCALAFGAIMQKSGMIRVIANKILLKVHNTKSLVLATVLSGIAANLIFCDQYLSIIITGQMYKDYYKENNVPGFVLSRAVESSATIMSPLVPWTDDALFMASVLGIKVLAFAPFSFFNLLTPIMTVLFAYLGWFNEDAQLKSRNRKLKKA